MPDPSTPPTRPPRVLITAGPTHEPIDAVRYLANRSSGRVGCAIADAAASRGWEVTLLLGPTHLEPISPDVDLIRFRTTADLESLLAEHQHDHDVLVMAAAVADYRPAPAQTDANTKLRRTTDSLTLTLEPTPDLLAACAQRRAPGQLLVGFALEPREELLERAAGKLARKSIDLIVANPLETMDSGEIEATILSRPELRDAVGTPATPGPISKREFASWLLDTLTETLAHTRPKDDDHAPT